MKVWWYLTFFLDDSAYTTSFGAMRHLVPAFWTISGKSSNLYITWTTFMYLFILDFGETCTFTSSITDHGHVFHFCLRGIYFVECVLECIWSLMLLASCSYLGVHLKVRLLLELKCLQWFIICLAKKIFGENYWSKFIWILSLMEKATELLAEFSR